MITALQLKQSQLDELYDWVDGLPLSKPKKNISRDFSDGILMAEIIQNFYPKIVEMHNYPSGNSYKVKLANWQTLKNKVLGKLGIYLTEDDCSRLANATPMAIQAVLYELKRVVDNAILMYENESSPQKMGTQFPTDKKTLQDNQKSVSNRPLHKHTMNTSSKVEELKQILSLIKEKIVIVQKSIERKDGQIRELEQILRGAGQ